MTLLVTPRIKGLLLIYICRSLKMVSFGDLECLVYLITKTLNIFSVAISSSPSLPGTSWAPSVLAGGSKKVLILVVQLTHARYTHLFLLWDAFIGSAVITSKRQLYFLLGAGTFLADSSDMGQTKSSPQHTHYRFLFLVL